MTKFVGIRIPMLPTVLSWGMGCSPTCPNLARCAPAASKDKAGSRQPLPALLSQVLLAFAVEFEREVRPIARNGATATRHKKGERVGDSVLRAFSMRKDVRVR